MNTQPEKNRIFRIVNRSQACLKAEINRMTAIRIDSVRI